MTIAKKNKRKYEQPVSDFLNLKRAFWVFVREGPVCLLRKARKNLMVTREEGEIGFISVFDAFKTRLRAKSHIRNFHKLFYYSASDTWRNTFWLGRQSLQMPMDLWILQEIIWEIQPDIIIETGTYVGGLSLFCCSIFELIGKGKVLTIDIIGCTANHPRLIKIIGDSTSDKVKREVERIVENKKTMVILDSSHNKKHVLEEMRYFSKFVSLGSYLIVEDTQLGGNPVRPDFGNGPMEAINEFFKYRDDFISDKSREKFLVTCSPNGFLKRVK